MPLPYLVWIALTGRHWAVVFLTSDQRYDDEYILIRFPFLVVHMNLCQERTVTHDLDMIC